MIGTRRAAAELLRIFAPNLYWIAFNFQTMLELMNVDTVMPRFNSILMEMSSPRELTHYKTGFWGRAQVNILLTNPGGDGRIYFFRYLCLSCFVVGCTFCNGFTRLVV